MGGTVDSKSDTVSDGKANKSTAFIAEVRKDEPLVTKRELWSYYRKSVTSMKYIYYNGDNGSGPYSYTQTLFQNIATAAGYDPVSGPGSSCLADTASGQRVLPWMGSTKSVSSIVLVANGVSFAIMTALFTSISSAGDYGTFGRWLLFVVTAICWASQLSRRRLTTHAKQLQIGGNSRWCSTSLAMSAHLPSFGTLQAHSNVGWVTTVRNYTVAMMKQVWGALKTYKQLPYTFVYLVAFFLLADYTWTVVHTAVLENQHKEMFSINIIVTTLLPLWGLIGIWINKFGAYNVIAGLFQIPCYSYSQTMMAELSPPGFDNMAIIDKSNNNWQGFPFLFALCMSASLVTWFGVDVTKGRRDAVRWAVAQRGG
ncbi:MFS general substrate transporter [Melanogaster broomeanus]|nr:MFS general substrate transporter [Melanogaster broomeanus]